MIALPQALTFAVPPELEARVPPEARGLARDGVRLLVTGRADGRNVHARFRELPEFLRPGDLVVVNDSATLPAALTATRADGSTLALHLSSQIVDDLWVVEPRQTQGSSGEVLTMPGNAAATLLTPHGRTTRLWLAKLDLPQLPAAYLRRWGRPIAYSYVEGSWPIDYYQTVYAREPGSAEMPSAGRPFTREVLASLATKGIQVARLTLHTGVSSLESGELPPAEPFAVPVETAEAVQAARARGGRIVAVGTTVVRALESAADERGRVVASRGWTDLVVTPERGVQVVDGLLTGFHEPKATHLAMLEAIAGRRVLDGAYRAALATGYLWHEFGDVHLIV